MAGIVMVTPAPATKRRIACKGWLPVAGWILGLLVHPLVAAEPAAQSSRPDDATEAAVALTVEGISPVSEDDDPRVLYILPWQPPTLPAKSAEPLDGEAADLSEPLDPIALERHRVFRQTLNPQLDSLTPIP